MGRTGTVIIFPLLLLVSWAAVAYTYVAFPLLIGFIARVAGRRSVAGDVPDDELPRVAVVVAAHNEERFIADKIRNTWELDYPPDRLTLLVGSDGSSDRTPDLLRAAHHPRLETRIFDARRGKVSVLNDLMACLDADVAVLSDADTRLAPDAVRQLVRHFRDPRVGCVNGALRIEHGGGVSGEGLYWRYELWIKRQETRLGFVIGCYGGILAIRPELYRPLPASTIVEDFVLTMRLLEQGKRVLFDPEARATEPASASAHDEWERKVRIGAGDFQALGLTRAMLHPRHGLQAFAFWSHKVLRWLAPFFLVLGLACNLVLALWPGAPGADAWRGLLALQALGVGAAAWAFRLPSGARLPGWLRPAAYFYLMNYALLCGFVRWRRGTQPVTWRQATRQAPKESPCA